MSAAVQPPAAERQAASAARQPALGSLARRRWLLTALLFAVAANWLLWASAVPFGEAPDEPSHLEVAQFVAAHGRLPLFGPDADQYVRLDQVGIPIESHALAPPLPYLLDGALIRLLPLPPVAAARLGSLLAALAAVALSYALAQVVFDNGQTTRPLALATAALVAAVPEVSFLAATVNSDVVALAAALGAACLWPRVGRPLGALAFGLALGLVLLAKYTAYPVAALALLAAAWPLARARRESGRRYASVRLGLVALGAVLVAGPWLLRNWALYGQPWPLGVSEAAFRALVPAVPVPGAPGSQQLLSADYARSWWEITFRSFWAGFGRVDLFAPAWCYALILAGLTVALWGLLRTLGDAARRASLAAALRRPAGLLLVGWPLAVWLAVFAASLGRYYPAHGRYLIPALPPLALGLALGWQAAARRRSVPVPSPLPAPGPLAPWLLVAGVAALNVYCLLAVVVPHYYGPAATRVTVTVDEPRPGDLATGSVPVRGWAVVSGRDGWQLGQIGGAPAWHAAATTVWATLDGEPIPMLAGGTGAARPDLARALGTPAVAMAGFTWQLDARALPSGLHTLAICVSDPAASDTVCVPIPLRVEGD